MYNDNKNWWEQKKGEAHDAVFSLIENIKIKQSGKSEENLRHLRLYGNAEVLGLRVGEFSKQRSLQKLALNVIQMTVDTIVARLSKNKPKPMFITEDGDYTMKRQAKRLEQYCLGQFSALDLYEIGPMVLRDACVFGDGWLHWYFDDGKIQCEKVFPEEIMVDEDEAIYGETRQIIRTKHVNKHRLSALYPKFSGEIEKAGTVENSYMFDNLDTKMISVAEVYRLGTASKEYKDGRHSIVISTATLLDESWTRDYLPYTRMQWNPRLLGYYSQGLAEMLTGIQVEINKLLMTIQQSMHLGSVPKIFVESGSKIVSSHLNNQIGTIVKYTGNVPTPGQLMRVPSELFVQLDKLYSRSFEQAGVSQLSTASAKPAGLNSGKALRDYHDIESERFAVHAQRYEEFYLDCARMIVKLSRDEAAKDKTLKTTYLDKKGLKKIEWSSIDLQEEEYVMRLYATNLLSDTPSGRLSDVNELMTLGLIDKRQAKSLLDFPDVEGVLSRENALAENVDLIIEKIIDDGIYTPPEDFIDFSYALPQLQQAYLKYQNMGLEQDKLELLRQWIEDALLIINPPQADLEDEEDREAEELTELGVDIPEEEEQNLDANLSASLPL